MSADDRQKHLFSLTNFMFGSTPGPWFRLLRQNRFAIDPPFYFRAAAVSLVTPVNALARLIEEQKWGERIASTRLAGPPIFLLGHWRSGTTHLHYMMSQDERFATPNNYQVARPFAFMGGGEHSALGRLAERLGLMPKTRPMDNVAVSFDSPQEDEQGLFMASLLSPLGGWFFLRNDQQYDKYLTFEDCSEAERSEWKRTLDWFNRKLTCYFGERQLLLKSPPHTGRIRLILEQYPDAKFVHIHRNPYDVFRSFRHFYDTLVRLVNLQRMRMSDVEDTIIRRYRLLHEGYFEQRELLGPDRLIDIRYEALEQAPIEQMRRIYDTLDLGGWDAFEPRLRRYLDGQRSYTKNPSPALPEPIRNRLADAWERSFREWDYAA